MAATILHRCKKGIRYKCVCVRACARAQLLSHVQLFVTPWTVARQALSVNFFMFFKTEPFVVRYITYYTIFF